MSIAVQDGYTALAGSVPHKMRAREAPGSVRALAPRVRPLLIYVRNQYAQKLTPPCLLCTI